MIVQRGQIAKMSIPDEWVEVPDSENVASIASRHDFQAPECTDIKVSFYYRGRPVSANAAEEFRKLLEKPVHILSSEEIDSVWDILLTAANPEAFTIHKAQTVEHQQKNVLMVEGLWKVRQNMSCEIFINADGSGAVVQQLSFTAPKQEYSNYLPEFQKSFASIEWLSN